MGAITSEWRLPDLIAQAMIRHHERPTGSDSALPQDKLAALAFFVGNLRLSASLQIAPDESELRNAAMTVLGLHHGSWADLQKETEAEYRSLLALFDDFVPHDVDVGRLLGEANRQLAEAAETSAARIVDVEAQRAALTREQKQLQNALREYRERAALDPLTNVLNRGALADATRAAIRRNLEQNVQLGVLFLDIDNFKKLNDAHGHEVGDRILKSVANLIGQKTRRRAVVGRYGGEEFVIVLEGLSADATREVADTIVKAYRALDAGALGASGPITCSVGALWAERLPFNSPEELFAAADELMYRAKRTGKDRYCFEQLGPTAQGEPALLPATRDAIVSSLSHPLAAPTAATAVEELLTVAQQLNDLDDDSFAGIRKQERTKVVGVCSLHYFTGSDDTLGLERAATRNISTGGIGLVAARPMIRGEPVEVLLDWGDSRLFLAGLVSFCRYINRSLHDMGIQFVTHAVIPIISGDAADALRKHDWLSRAHSAKADGELQSIGAP